VPVVLRTSKACHDPRPMIPSHMDTAILRKHLAKAEHQVTDAEQRVARQRELLRELVGSGLNSLPLIPSGNYQQPSRCKCITRSA
jgi:hypothetical protein